MDKSESEPDTAPGLGKASVPRSDGASGVSPGVQPSGTTPSSGTVGRAGTIGAPATSGMSGAETNDREPGGGTVAADMVNDHGMDATRNAEANAKRPDADTVKADMERAERGGSG